MFQLVYCVGGSLKNLSHSMLTVADRGEGVKFAKILMTSVGDIEIIHIKKVGQICFLDPLTLFLTLGGGGGGLTTGPSRRKAAQHPQRRTAPAAPDSNISIPYRQ